MFSRLLRNLWTWLDYYCQFKGVIFLSLNDPLLIFLIQYVAFFFLHTLFYANRKKVKQARERGSVSLWRSALKWLALFASLDSGLVLSNVEQQGRWDNASLDCFCTLLALGWTLPCSFEPCEAREWLLLACNDWGSCVCVCVCLCCYLKSLLLGWLSAIRVGLWKKDTRQLAS